MTVQRYLQEHTCSAIAYTVVTVAFLSVDQIARLFELPPRELLLRNPAMLASFGGIVVLGLLYLVAAWWIVPPEPPPAPTPPKIPPGVVARLRHWGQAARESMATLARHVRENLSVRRLGLSSLLILAGLALLALDLHRPTWPIVGTPPARTATAWLLLGWAAWWLANPAPSDATFLGRMLFRSLAALSLFNLIGEALWMLAVHEYGVSFRMFTLWGILHLGFCVVLVGRTADHWSRLSQLPVPLLLLVTLVLAVGVPQSPRVGRAVPWLHVFVADAPEPESLASNESSGDSAPATREKTSPAVDVTQLASTGSPPIWNEAGVDDDEDRWLQHLNERLDHLPHPDRPVLLVAASGGGSRAALFTALVLEQLRRWTPRMELVDPSRPPALADDLPARAHLADQILLISSVSGGTLASSEYVARTTADAGFKTIEAPATCNESEVRWRMNQEIARLADWDPLVQQRAYGEGGSYYVERARAECADPEPLWFHRSEFIDHVCTDFMAPLLRGALFPGQERGEAVQAFWRDHLTNDACPLNHSNVESHHLSVERRRRVPLLIANVTEIDRGSALLVSFPPLPPFFFTGKYARFHAFPCRDLTNVGPPDCELTRLDLSESARLSANFPWGFSTARLKRGGDVDAEHLIDGGVFDNTGIATIRYVIERLHDWSETYAKDGDEAGASARLAAEIMRKLRRRGVILIEIDSGAKQEPARGIATLLPGIFAPVTALENVSYTGADRVAEEHLRRLKKIFAGPTIAATLERLRRHVDDDVLRAIDRDFGFKLEDGNLTMFHSLRITCNHEANVMTAWALAPSDKAKVSVQFLIERSLAAERLAQLIEVQERTATLVELFARPPRPPERYVTDELVEQYYDLLKFNRALELDLRKTDIQQARTFASLRRGAGRGKSLTEAQPVAPFDRTTSAPLARPPEAIAKTDGPPQPAAAGSPSEVSDTPVWKQFDRSPSAGLRRRANDWKRGSAP